jgi:hypothetical protein
MELADAGNQAKWYRMFSCAFEHHNGGSLFRGDAESVENLETLLGPRVGEPKRSNTGIF